MVTDNNITERYPAGNSVSQYGWDDNHKATVKFGKIGKRETFHGTDGRDHEGVWLHWNDGTSQKVTIKDLDLSRNDLLADA